MEYLNYMYDTIEDMYYYLFENKYDCTQMQLIFKNSTNEIENENEINKVIDEVRNEIRIDKEIKELENRYIELCKFVNENKNIDDDNNNNNNKSNNDGALKIKVPSI